MQLTHLWIKPVIVPGQPVGPQCFGHYSLSFCCVFGLHQEISVSAARPYVPRAVDLYIEVLGQTVATKLSSIYSLHQQDLRHLDYV